MLTILLLGNVQILDGEKFLPPFPTQRSRELFAVLASRPNHPHSRASLAGNLWPEKTEEKARASLNTELWRVRQVLGEANQSLELTRDSVSLNIPLEQVDIHQFRALVKRGDVRSLEQAVALYRGEFLEGCYADWCLLERESLADQLRLALEGLLRRHESRGELTEAISFAKRLNSYDPLREEMHRALMRLYAALGDRPAALAQYQSCKTILKRELGVEPMPETETLFVKIRQTAPLEDHWQARRDAVGQVTQHRLDGMRAAKQYLSELYTPRPALDSKVEEFIASDAVGLIIIGHSGCGKTAFLAHLAETRRARGDMLLLLDSSALTLNVQRELARQVWGSESISALEALTALGRDAAAKGKLVWVVLDELNAFHDLGASPADLLRRLDALIASLHQQPDLRTVKFIIACRKHPWRQLALGGAANLNWQCYFAREPLSLAQFTLEETRSAFDAYRKYFHLQNSFDALSEEMRERCRTPFLLRLAAETWQGKAIPASGSAARLFREYFERVVANPSARNFVAELITRIARQRQAQLPLNELRANPLLQYALSDDPRAPLHQLLEAGVLVVSGSEFAPRVRFTHERLLEYLLAQYYDAQCAEGLIGEDCIIQMARGSWDFPALWGAALTLLLLGKNADQFILLAESGFSEARQLATEGLVAVHQEDASLAVSLAARLLERPSVDAKRVALFAASRMGEDGFNLFRSAAGSREAETRQTAFVVANAVYQRDPQLVLDILQHLSADMSLQTLVTSPTILQSVLRLMGLFTRYGLEKRALDRAEKLIETLAVKKLRLPAESSRFGKTLVRRILSIDSVSWPADKNAVAAIAQQGSLTALEENAFRRVLDHLRRGRGRADGTDQSDLHALFESRSDAVRFLAHHHLSALIHVGQPEALTFAQSLFDAAADPEARLWILASFMPLSAPTKNASSEENLHTLESLTARFAEENSNLFFEGVSQGTLSLFGPIAFFPLGMYYARAGKFDFPLLAARMAADDPALAARTLRVLAPVGWFHPQEALAIFQSKVDFKKTLHPLVAESLGRMWVSHPEVVDHFLRGAGADESAQRQVHAAVDVEQTLRAINLIHNTDLRVSSILLNAPYGKWVTDSVFQGYVDSKSLDEAASRFGRGLVDVYMESGWKLKRILGLEK